MQGLGTAINIITILIGGAIGLIGKKALPDRTTRAIMHVMGLFTMVVGLRMLWPGKALLSALISLVIGGLIGEGLRFEERLHSTGERILRRFGGAGASSGQGFLAATLLFCVGPLAIMGSLADGLSRDYRLLATKSALDGIASIPLAATLGPGVLLSTVPVLIYQGSITFAATYLHRLQEGLILSGLNTVGGFLVLAIGLTIAEIKQFRVANLLPALVVQVVLALAGVGY